MNRALIIGVSKYEHGLPNLPGVRSDVEAVQSVLRSIRGPLEEASVQTLLDEQATQEEVHDHLSALFGRAKRDDLLFVYISGHGHAADNSYYFVPYGASTTRAALKCIRLEDLRRQLDACASERVLVWLDFCHAGGIVPRRGAATPTAPMELISRSVASLQGAGKLIIAACGADKLAWETSSGGRFTSFLIRGLRGEARNLQREITVGSLFDFVDEATLAFDQRPVLYGRQEGRIVLAKIPEADEESEVDVTSREAAAMVSELLSLRSGRRNLYRTVVADHLAFMDRQLRQLLQEERVQIPYYQMEALVSPFYRGIADTYVGVDSHLPSVFQTVHPYLLDALIESTHPAGLKLPGERQCYDRHLVRINPIDLLSLQSDYRSNPEVVGFYFRAHERVGIDLLRVDPNVVGQALRHYPRLQTSDVGIWPRNCALFFSTPIEIGQDQWLQLANAGDTDLYQAAVGYVQELLGSATRIAVQRDPDTGFSTVMDLELDSGTKEDFIWSLGTLFEPPLADEWAEFVSPDVRIKRGEGKFLLDYVLSDLEPGAAIYDAAAGVGVETLFLDSHGYRVTPNEIDWTLNDHMAEYMRQHDRRDLAEISRYDWRHLAAKYEDEQFDVVFALGNSLTCLTTREDMARCIKGFWHILKRGGKLVLDERNYRHMLQERQRMRRQNYRLPGKVIYCSENVMAKPSFPLLDGSRQARLEYYRSGNRVGTFPVYVFEAGEVVELLQKNGFVLEATFWDFEMKPKEDAEFITYLCKSVPKV